MQNTIIAKLVWLLLLVSTGLGAITAQIPSSTTGIAALSSTLAAASSEDLTTTSTVIVESHTTVTQFITVTSTNLSGSAVVSISTVIATTASSVSAVTDSSTDITTTVTQTAQPTTRIVSVMTNPSGAAVPYMPLESSSVVSANTASISTVNKVVSSSGCTAATVYITVTGPVAGTSTLTLPLPYSVSTTTASGSVGTSVGAVNGTYSYGLKNLKTTYTSVVSASKAIGQSATSAGAATASSSPFITYNGTVPVTSDAKTDLFGKGVTGGIIAVGVIALAGAALHFL